MVTVNVWFCTVDLCGDTDRSDARGPLPKYEAALTPERPNATWLIHTSGTDGSRFFSTACSGSSVSIRMSLRPGAIGTSTTMRFAASKSTVFDSQYRHEMRSRRCGAGLAGPGAAMKLNCHFSRP